MRQAISVAESHWFAREARHHLVYATGHVCAVLVACYALSTAIPAVGYHASRLWTLLDRRWA